MYAVSVIGKTGKKRTDHIQIKTFFCIIITIEEKIIRIKPMKFIQRSEKAF